MINLFGISQGKYDNPTNYAVGSRDINYIQKEQKQKLKEEQYNDIFEHEKKHKDTAGNLGGPIVIENNADGIPVKGHVDIKMPVLNKANPDKTIEHADIVIKSAMAPDDPSAQDYKVANEAKSIKSEAESLKRNNGEDDLTPKTERHINLFA